MRDCDCVPGHRCDCWEYRSPADGLRETLERHVVATATSRGVQFKLSHSEYHVPAPAVRDWLRAALAAQVPAQEERLDELRALSDAATPGAWRLRAWAVTAMGDADAAFMVAAVNYVRSALGVESKEPDHD